MAGICLLTVVVFVVMLAKIAQIKREKGDDYTRRALSQLITSGSNYDSVVNPNRGAILDRNKQPLAYSMTVFDVFLDVKMLLVHAGKITLGDEKDKKDKEPEDLTFVIDETFKAINAELGIPLDELYSYVEKNAAGEYEYKNNMHLIIKTGLTAKQNLSLEELKDRLIVTPFDKNGEIPASERAERKGKSNLVMRDVYTESRSKREYTHKTLAPQVVGFLRGDSKYGIESRYDSRLTGKAGRIFKSISSGYVTTERVAAKEGDTLVTTIDADLQRFSESLCVKYAAEYGAPNAAIIVLNPNTGEIYAMAETPAFDVTDPLNPEKITDLRAFAQKELIVAETLASAREKFIEDGGTEEAWEALHKNDGYYDMWKNFNITSTFEPGSIFKPFTIAAALEEGVIDLGDTYYCPGFKVVNGTKINCHKTSGHGSQTLDEAIMNSCNVALMDIGEKLGRELFYKYQHDFGYGEKTGIDLPAEESAAALLHSLIALQETELATASFGQRFNCTPIQAVTSFASLINGGFLLKPYVVAQYIGENGVVTVANEPTVVRKVITKETSDYLRETMKKVVSPQGTGRRAVIEGYSIGGKTGTGEQGTKGVHSVDFIGYIPVENPQYLVFTLIDHIPEDRFVDGQTSAAPMIKEVFEFLIKNRGILRDGDKDALDDDKIVLPDYSGKQLVDAIRDLNRLNLDYEIIGGSGCLVEYQNPSPGAVMSENEIVWLSVKSDGITPLSPVPDVIGLTPEIAAQKLTDEGFVPITVYDAKGGESGADENGILLPGETPPGTVYKQMPAWGVNVPLGSEVKIRVK